MKGFTTILSGAAAIALAYGAAPAWAVPISVTNFDFEAAVPGGLTPGIDQNESSPSGTSSVPGWTIDQFGSAFNAAGVWAPKAGGVYFNSPASWGANQVGFLNFDSNINQNLNATLTGTGGTVTVTLLLGEAKAPFLGITPSDDSITLLANGAPIASQLLSAGVGPFVTPGGFEAETYSIAVAAGFTGETLGLELANVDDPGTLYLDNIAVDGGAAATPGGGGGGGGGGGSNVPEPASYLLFGMGLVGFAAWRMRGGMGLVQAA